ncbi:uncharacterized protein, YigZ family [Mycobacteroides abscessus subsp. abscessus]|nr:uncharacterized protein, YigZ family [Mycobacteroides abscessus subsp. abscessus]
MRVMKAQIDYTLLGKIENELRSSVYQIKEINYLDKVEIAVFVEQASVEAYKDWFIDLSNGQCRLEEGDLLYLEEDVS